jgi:hypothetical protein
MIFGIVDLILSIFRLLKYVKNFVSLFAILLLLISCKKRAFNDVSGVRNHLGENLAQEIQKSMKQVRICFVCVP